MKLRLWVLLQFLYRFWCLVLFLTPWGKKRIRSFYPDETLSDEIVECFCDLFENVINPILTGHLPAFIIFAGTVYAPKKPATVIEDMLREDILKSKEYSYLSGYSKACLEHIQKCIKCRLRALECSREPVKLLLRRLTEMEDETGLF